MVAFTGINVMVVDAKPANAVRKTVRQRVEAGVCLQCNEPAPGDRRGLCRSCYHATREALKSLPRTDRFTKEGSLIRRGKLLPNRAGHRGEKTDQVKRLLGIED